MKSFVRSLAVAVVVAGASAVPASAAPVYYTLIGSTNAAFSVDPWNLGPVHEESFQFVAPGFITTDTPVTKANTVFCVSCWPFGTTVEFFPDAVLGAGRDQISFTDAIGVVFGFFFDPGSFGAIGTYHAKNIPPGSLGNVGQLTVSYEAPRAVPEPSLSLLVLTGVGAVYRRRRQNERAV